MVVDSPELAAAYARELRGAVGRARRRPLRLRGAAHARRSTGARCAPGSRPGHGEELSHRIAHAIGARARAGADRLAGDDRRAGDRHARGGRGRGAGRPARRGRPDRRSSRSSSSGASNGRSAWKIPLLASVLEHADFRGKPSTPYTPDSVHDFMHAKVTVADDTVFVGSFNLSRSGERNAENVLEVHDPELADQHGRLHRRGQGALRTDVRRLTVRCAT